MNIIVLNPPSQIRGVGGEREEGGGEGIEEGREEGREREGGREGGGGRRKRETHTSGSKCIMAYKVPHPRAWNCA